MTTRKHGNSTFFRSVNKGEPYEKDSHTVSYTHLTLPTKRIV